MHSQQTTSGGRSGVTDLTENERWAVVAELMLWTRRDTMQLEYGAYTHIADKFGTSIETVRRIHKIFTNQRESGV